MLFALRDYCNYRHVRGRYARNNDASYMGGAWQGELSPIALEVLRPGDFFLVEGLGSFQSWLVMYLTSSEISHVATYLGSGAVVHATPSGVQIDPIGSLFARGSRVLPVHLNVTDDDREVIIETQMSLLGTPYGYGVAIKKGLRILTGRDWGFFRWRIASDVILPMLLAGAAQYIFTGRQILVWLCVAYLLVVAVHRIAWRIFPPKYDGNWAKPCDAIHWAKAGGDSILFDGFQLHQLYGPKPGIDDVERNGEQAS